MPTPMLNLAGRTIGKLLVLEREKKRAGHYYWRCRCDCSREVSLRHDVLVRPEGTRSCGCFYRRMPPNGNRWHGLSKLPENAIWRSMIGRCTIPSHSSFDRYGRRGITVCDRWLNSFEAFLEDMGRRPSPRHSIERGDNDGPYAPWNCQWVIRKVQDRNNRRNHRITAFGETLPLIDWAARTGLQAPTIRKRLKAGWDAERALSTPADGGHSK